PPPPPAPPSTSFLQEQSKQQQEARRILPAQPVKQVQQPRPAQPPKPQSSIFFTPQYRNQQMPFYAPRMDGPFTPPGLAFGTPNFRQNGPRDMDMRHGDMGYGRWEQPNLGRPPFEPNPFLNLNPFAPPQNFGGPQFGAHVLNPRPCAFCGDLHPSERCLQFDTYEKRRAVINRMNLCHNCLGPRLPSCNAPSHKISCPICHKHNTHVALCKMLIK
ncbi:hypothetical protein PMAYCL1PPCAC_13071, partial [Pristionchus mayeri]